MRTLPLVLLLLAATCAPAPRSPTPAPPSADGLVRVRGRLVPDREFLRDEEYRAAFRANPSLFRGAEVVFAGAAGEVVAIAGADGRYDVRLARGSYRVFVRGERAVSAVPNLWYEPADPAGAPGRPRRDLAPLVELSADVVGLDVPVLHTARIVGQVVSGGRPLPGAVVRQSSNAAVVAGTDIAVTDAAGHFEVIASPGPRTLEVTHPGFARGESPWLYLRPGQRLEHQVTLTPGRAASRRTAGRGRPAKPSVTGVVLRRDGKPMPSARVLALATDSNSSERGYTMTDAQGRFTLSGLSRGRYLVTASTPGDGLARAEVALPQRELRLVLGGTTRIEGTSPYLREGAFLLRLPDAASTERGLDRLVPVHDGRFAVEVPAAYAKIELRWQDQTGWFAIDPWRPANRVAVILGPPRPKRVRGVLRLAGEPVPGVVSALATPSASEPTQVEASRDGRFVIDTYSGAELTAEWSPDDPDVGEDAEGSAQVSSRTGRDEHLDIDLLLHDWGED